MRPCRPFHLPGFVVQRFENLAHGGTRLSAALARLDRLVDWERRDRAPGQGRGMRQGLAPSLDLLARLGDPQRAWRSVHVAGTKGKGSVCSLVAAALRRLGIAEGVYASPHVERINERIRIRGREIEDGLLADVLERALGALDEATRDDGAARSATWFDVLSAAACLAFAETGLAWVVLECGLGGRLDSTNAVASDLVVLTNVGLEHTAILGQTRAAIAAEKAGIIRPGAITVSAVGGPRDEAGAVVARIAAERGSALVEVGRVPGASLEARNVALAGAVLDQLTQQVPGAGAHLLDPTVLVAARLPGRLERGQVSGVPVVLDGAHVPESLEACLRDLGADPVLQGRTGRPTVVLALGRDKDASGLLKVLRGGVDRVLCTSLGPGPTLRHDELHGAARRLGLPAAAIADPHEALDMALENAKRGGWVLVTGSLHLIGELRARVVTGSRTSAC